MAGLCAAVLGRVDSTAAEPNKASDTLVPGGDAVPAAAAAAAAAAAVVVFDPAKDDKS
jgi:hypothetical protein